jgi:hypothetical protein
MCCALGLMPLHGNIEDLELDKSDDDFFSHFGHRAQARDATPRIVSLFLCMSEIGNWLWEEPSFTRAPERDHDALVFEH